MDLVKANILIYIPHLIDSMTLPNNQYFHQMDLHSTLVRFYVSAPARRPRSSPIYIPHWLDSMGKAEGERIRKRNIYIPHWLDSMYCNACN